MAVIRKDEASDLGDAAIKSGEVPPSIYYRATLASKLAALVAIFLFAPWAWWALVVEETDRMLWFENWALLIWYLSAVAISFIGICVLPFLGDWRVRVPLA